MYKKLGKQGLHWSKIISIYKIKQKNAKKNLIYYIYYVQVSPLALCHGVQLDRALTRVRFSKLHNWIT
jgi:hypothetical protein